MNVQTLIDTLKTINPNATVNLAVTKESADSETPQAISGDIVFISVIAIDNTDRRVFLSNCVADNHGALCFDVEPQFKRFHVNPAEGKADAAAALEEQLNSEPTVSLANHLDVERMKTTFRAIASLGGQA